MSACAERRTGETGERLPGETAQMTSEVSPAQETTISLTDQGMDLLRPEVSPMAADSTGSHSGTHPGDKYGEKRRG